VEPFGFAEPQLKYTGLHCIYITSNTNGLLKLTAVCRMRFLEDASARAVETVNKSRETIAVEVPAADSGDQ